MTDNTNREWLKSLSDKALKDEIKYGRVLAEGDRHKAHYQRELEEAEAEKRRREAE
jgi:hypothetical protein